METQKKSLSEIHRNGYFVFVCTLYICSRRWKFIVLFHCSDRQPTSQPASQTLSFSKRTLETLCQLLFNSYWIWISQNTCFIRSLAESTQSSSRFFFAICNVFSSIQLNTSLLYLKHVYATLSHLHSAFCLRSHYFCSTCKENISKIFDAGWNKVISQWLLNYTRP